MLDAAAHLVVIQSSDIILKVKTTIHQAQNNRLSTELLRGDTGNKINEFVQNSAIFRGIEPLFKNPLNLYQIEVSYFYKPAENI